MPPIIAAARLALLASEGLVTLGPVMGICSQAGQTIFGAGWLAVRGCKVEWAFWTALPLLVGVFWVFIRIAMHFDERKRRKREGLLP